MTWGHPVTSGIASHGLLRFQSAHGSAREPKATTAERLVRLSALHQSHYRRPELPAFAACRDSRLGLSETTAPLRMSAKPVQTASAVSTKPSPAFYRRDPEGEIILLEGRASRQWRQALERRFAAGHARRRRRGCDSCPGCRSGAFFGLLVAAIGCHARIPTPFCGGNTTLEALGGRHARGDASRRFPARPIVLCALPPNGNHRRLYRGGPARLRRRRERGWGWIRPQRASRRGCHRAEARDVGFRRRPKSSPNFEAWFVSLPWKKHATAMGMRPDGHAF